MTRHICRLAVLLTSAIVLLAETTETNIWQDEIRFTFLLGGLSIGESDGVFKEVSGHRHGTIEYVSLSCVGPAEVSVENVMLIVSGSRTDYKYELPFVERHPAPNGTKTVVVASPVKIRVKFGNGPIRMGFIVWNGSSSESLGCRVAISGVLGR